ncbi:pilin [Patescibacteria group bacterium]|nr:pilin [Patescibacteria group bacterium]
MKKILFLSILSLVIFLPITAFAFADDAECNNYCQTACNNEFPATPEECTVDCQADQCYLQGDVKSESDIDSYVLSYTPPSGNCTGQPTGGSCGEGGTCMCYEVTMYEGDSCNGGTGVILEGECPGNNYVRCCEPTPDPVTGETGTGSTGTGSGSGSRTIEVTNPLGDDEASRNPVEIIGNVIRSFLIFMGVITLIMFIYAGILMMMSGGNEEAFKKGRNIMVYTIIGLVIVLSSYSILTFVFNRLAESTGAAVEQAAPTEETPE